ncbi:MAG: family 16 glycoside hydrolase [Vicinamibacterales bacterium]
MTAEPATLHGKKGLRLTLPEEVRQRVNRLESLTPEEREKSMTPEERGRVRRGLPFLVGQLALVQELEFSNGTIEVELAGTPEPAAGESARGFVGIAFRLQEDLQTYDAFYLRPTNGRAEDQERRNHSVQYISHPHWPWFRLRKETPGKYESYVDLVPGEWTQIRIEVDGKQARLYVHGNEHATLMVNDVKSAADASGGVGLWLEPGTVAHFRNLTVKPRSPEPGGKR